MAGKIFISYRRNDSPGDARSIRDRLASAFGEGNVFMDVDALEAGQKFEAELSKSLSQCDVFLAIIGPRWEQELIERQQSNVRDYVADEIEAALARNITVIPVLVGRAVLPHVERLPQRVGELFARQALTVSHERFGRESGELKEIVSKSLRKGPSSAGPIERSVVAARNLRTFWRMGVIYWWLLWWYSQTSIPRANCLVPGGSKLELQVETRPLVEDILRSASSLCGLRGDTFSGRLQDLISISISAAMQNFLLGSGLIVLLIFTVNFAEAPKSWQRRVLGLWHWMLHVMAAIVLYVLVTEWGTLIGIWLAHLAQPYIGAIASLLQTFTYVALMIFGGAFVSGSIFVVYIFLTALIGFPHVNIEISYKQAVRNWLDS